MLVAFIIGVRTVKETKEQQRLEKNEYLNIMLYKNEEI
jgi:hypothetical protein